MADTRETDNEKDERVEDDGGATRARRALPTAAWVVVAVAALVVGVLAGHFLLPETPDVALDGRTTLSASELDSTVATYTFDGQTTRVSAREVLQEVAGSSSPSANDDGTYNVPSASDVLAYVQNNLLVADAQARGLSVSDDEVSSFASSQYGTDDLASLASAYGIEEDYVRSTLSDSLLMSKLQDEVTTTQVPDKPTEPTAPADGEEDTPTADYASYVIGLLGDEWDSDANTWARTDGTYYATLSGYEISNDAATYAAAQAAYNVAESAYETASTQRSAEWNSYTDTLLSRATLQLGSLAE